jgi:hypothetical protein
MQHTAATLLVGTHHGHFEITSRQDVENAIVLALAPMFTRFQQQLCRATFPRDDDGDGQPARE